MRKHLKKIVTMLLVVAMIFTMLPTVVAASPTYTATPIEGIPEEGQTFVIYSPSAVGVFAGTASGGAIGNSPAATSEESSNIGVREGAGVYKLVKNSDGTYYITCGGMYLHTDASENLSLKAAPEKGAKWKLEAQSGDGFAGYSIANAEIKYGSRDIYIEYYSSAFKAWTCGAMSAIYCFNFYAVDASVDEDGDGYLGVKPERGERPADGDTVVIFNEYASACFGNEDAGSLTPVESSAKNGTINPGNGALIFTVHYDGSKYYTFENNGKYLWTNEEEELCFVEEESDNTKWYLEEATGGYIIYNKAAKYNNRNVCIEYFGNAFSGWTYNGSESIFAMKFFRVEDSFHLGYVLNPSMKITAGDANLGVDYSFKVSLDDSTEITSMAMTYAADNGTAVALEPTEVSGYNYTYDIPASAFDGKSSLTLKGEAENEYGMKYSAEAKITIHDEPMIVSVSPDANAATGDDKCPEITVNIANCGTNPTVVMTIDGTAVTPKITADKITYTSATNMIEERHTVYVSITRADGKKTEKTWSFFVGEEGLSLYFGQIHSHTAEYSDGAGTLEQAYEHAMEADDVDFLIVTDHSNYFDTTSTATTSSYYDLTSLSAAATGGITKWEEARATAAAYNELSSEFIAAYGYEMTWSGGPGHTNSFNTYGTVSRNNATLNDKTNSYAGMHLYNDLMVNANLGLDVDGNPVAEGVKTKYLEDAPVVSQFNHPGTTFGNFDDFAGYTPTRDTVLCLIEVGNGEGAVGGSSYWPSYSEYDLCLSKGWHVAPTNNQDNHKGKWGDANTCRDVVMTDDFSEAGLYTAMSNRQVYATEDQNLRIYYYLDGYLMGSIIDIGEEEIETVNIKLSISDPDGETIGKVQIIGENGIALKSFDATGSTYELDTTIANTDAYYYIKVTQADGDIAVTAPVWVGVATPITANISNDAALCVVGQEEKITSVVTNAAAYAYEINSVEFTVTVAGEEHVIKTFDETVSVAAGESKTYSFDYVRSFAGEQTIEVVYTGTYNGKEFKCRASMDQKVYKAEDLVKVAVDSGHTNYYISGDYSSTVNNMIDFCAQNGVQCEFLKEGEFTYEKLSQYSLLILTVPYRRNAGEATMYTEAEIADLAKYVKDGGNVILCSKSDRDNTYDNCSENTNALLEAIGAHSRVVNGIVVDNDLKANEAYRIYLSSIENFNTEHRFTKGAYTSSNAFGTTPAADNETGFQLYNGGAIEILEGYEDSVEVLVRGYQSTWVSHYDGYFTGSAFIPEYDITDPSKVVVEKGNVNVMTYEDLPYGNWVITSGVTFFSDYDIKDDVDYANKFIVRNILRELTGEAENEEKATDILTVKSKTEGRYAIEGYVTSNASGYDQDTAFFDCIYVQDKHGNGINVFPVAGNYAVGMNVRCYGAITFYCGEVELNLSSDYGGSIRIISDEIYNVPAKTVSCAEAMADKNIGNLMKVGGVVTDIHKTEGVIDKIYVRDTTGEACVFINGYIMKEYTGLDELKVGMTVTAIGVGSRDVDESSATAAIFARLRVRDRSEIVIVNATPDISAAFNDVSKTDWFYDAVNYCVNNDLMNGVGNRSFAPNNTLTRAMVVTVLYRLAGSPEVEEAASYKDVASDAWFADAVAWAEANEIVTGYPDGTFRPNDDITREQIAVILCRYSGGALMGGDLTAYPDAGTVSEYAVESLGWAVAMGLIKGDNHGNLNPQNNATRAEFATIIMRYLEKD